MYANHTNQLAFGYYQSLSFNLPFNSCRKLDKSIPEPPTQNVKHPLEERFFTVSDSVPAIVKKVAAYLQSKNNKSAIAATIIKEVGLPVWDKSFIIEQPTTMSRINGKTSSNDTSYIFVPIVVPETIEVDGALACKIIGDSVTVNFLNEKNYSKYGFDKTNPRNATRLTRLMMHLQNNAFGTENFVVTDQRLLSDVISKPDSTQKEIVRFVNPNKAKEKSRIGNKTASTNSYQVVEICSSIDFYGCPMHPGQLCIDPKIVFPIGSCSNYILWSDNSGGSDGYGGGSGSDPGSSGSGGGGGGGGSSASYSAGGYMQQQLGLLTTDLSFLNTQYELSLEAFNYLNVSEDGLLSFEERKNLLISHLLLLRDATEYRDYCLSITNQNAEQYGNYYPWLKNSLLVNTNLFLSKNLQTLKLNASEAYFLLKNSLINKQISQFLTANNNSEGAKFRALLAIEDVLNGKPFSLSPLANQYIIDSLAGYPCAQKILATLPNLNTETKNIIQDVFNVTQDINLTYYVDQSLSGTSVDGNHRGAGAFIFNGNIGINPDILKQASKEYILVTFIHEALHAFIRHNVDLYNAKQIDSVTFKEHFLIFWNPEPSDPRRILTPSEKIEHEQMAQKYISFMVNAIKSFNPLVSEEFATALAWGGLEDTRIYFTKVSNGEKFDELNRVGRNVFYSVPEGASLPQFFNYSNYNATKCQ